MTDEVLAAIEALRAGGAERISVGDWHMVGTNVERERMPAGVEVRPIADLALDEAEPSMAKAHGGPLDAVVMIGHHASTPSPRGFCSHTFIWEMEVLLDGEPLNEVQVYAQALAAEGIPVLVAAGDRWMLEELGEGELGGAAAGRDQGGRGPGRRPLASTPAEPTPSWRERSPPRSPAPRSRRRPAATRPSCGSWSRARRSPAPPSPSPRDLLTAIATVFRTSQVSREYRQLAKLLPAGHDSRLRGLQRRLGSVSPRR